MSLSLVFVNSTMDVEEFDYRLPKSCSDSFYDFVSAMKHLCNLQVRVPIVCCEPFASIYYDLGIEDQDLVDKFNKFWEDKVLPRAIKEFEDKIYSIDDVILEGDGFKKGYIRNLCDEIIKNCKDGYFIVCTDDFGSAYTWSGELLESMSEGWVKNVGNRFTWKVSSEEGEFKIVERETYALPVN